MKATSENIADTSEKIFNFVEFIKAQDDHAIEYDYRHGVISFEGAGNIVFAIQQYIDENPDNVDNKFS